MRSLVSRLIVAASLFSVISASEKPQLANVEEDVLGKPAPAPAEASTVTRITKSEDNLDGSTTFNGISVPPMKDFQGELFDEQAKDGYWFVKHFSPYCPHCITIAPSWQTLYEFYYTSNPIASSSQSTSPQDVNSFTKYYNFRFGSLDCVVWGDACNAHEIRAFPTFILYKDGKEIKRYDGKKDMEGWSVFVEETLETIRPGSRSSKKIKLPEPGDKSAPESVGSHSSAPKSEGAVVGSAPQKKLEEPPSKVLESATASKAIAKPAKPTTTPNLAGNSIPLTHESFQKLVTTTQDPWFIKFYAPWCHHCQALEPNWRQMAKELRGKLNVGEVNCDQQSRLCSDVRVKGYPTIHFFRGGERVEYDGLRGLGDLVSYSKKALDIGMGVEYVDAAGFKKLEETEEVIFVYFYDHATTSEDFAALDRLTLSLIGHAKLVKTDSVLLSDKFKIHTWPRLIVSRDGRPSYYNALTPKDMRDFYRVLAWMKSVWLPIVPELTASNSRELMHGKLVVLGILSRNNLEEFILDKREIKSAALEWMEKETHAFQAERQDQRDAKQVRIEEAEDRNDQRALRAAKSIRIEISEEDRKQVSFAWVDGVFWERWIRTTYGIEVRDGHRVIINDEDNKRYWDQTVSGGDILPSRTSILETLPKLVADPPKLSPKYTTGKIAQIYYRARSFSRGHPWLSVGMSIGAFIVLALWGRGRIRRARGVNGGGFFQLDGKERLLNGGGTGKVD